MRSTLIVASLALAMSCSTSIMAQSELKRYELTPVFTSITMPENFGSRTEAGFGGRFTFNFNENFAAEAEVDFFPAEANCFNFNCTFENNGRLTQGFAGVKAGKRFKSFGIFAKARPGVASFSQGDFDLIIQNNPFIFPPFPLNRGRRTNFAFDLGGVVEIYHSKRIFTRFDAGDTMIHNGDRVITVFQVDSITGATTIFPIPIQSKTTHNFQFSAGVGFRF